MTQFHSTASLRLWMQRSRPSADTVHSTSAQHCGPVRAQSAGTRGRGSWTRRDWLTSLVGRATGYITPAPSSHVHMDDAYAPPTRSPSFCQKLFLDNVSSSSSQPPFACADFRCLQGTVAQLKPLSAPLTSPPPRPLPFLAAGGQRRSGDGADHNLPSFTFVLALHYPTAPQRFNSIGADSSRGQPAVGCRPAESARGAAGPHTDLNPSCAATPPPSG